MRIDEFLCPRRQCACHVMNVQWARVQTTVATRHLTSFSPVPLAKVRDRPVVIRTPRLTNGPDAWAHVTIASSSVAPRRSWTPARKPPEPDSTSRSGPTPDETQMASS